MSIVATSEGSGWWHMVEDSTGVLYASEYSQGNQDSAELYAYNIWKSSDNGATWAKFYSAPHQSSPGAKDAIRHIHVIAIDKNDQLYISFGDTPLGFSGLAGSNYQLNNNGTLGTLISVDANGITSFMEAPDGTVTTGGDYTPFYLKRYNATGNVHANLVKTKTAFDNPRYWCDFIQSHVVTKEGVIVGVTTGSTTNKEMGRLIASADNGLSWQVLNFNSAFTAHYTLTLNESAPNPLIYIGRSPFMSMPIITKAQLNHRFDTTHLN